MIHALSYRVSSCGSTDAPANSKELLNTFRETELADRRMNEICHFQPQAHLGTLYFWLFRTCVLPWGLASPALYFEHNAKNYYKKYIVSSWGETLGIRKRLRGLGLATYKDPGQKWSQGSWDVSTPRSLCDHQLIFLALWRKKLLGGEVSWPRSQSYVIGGIRPCPLNSCETWNVTLIYCSRQNVGWPSNHYP